MKTPRRRQRRRFGVFVVNFEHISRLVPVFLFLTWNMLMLTGIVIRTTSGSYTFSITSVHPSLQ